MPAHQRHERALWNGNLGDLPVCVPKAGDNVMSAALRARAMTSIAHANGLFEALAKVDHHRPLEVVKHLLVSLGLRLLVQRGVQRLAKELTCAAAWKADAEGTDRKPSCPRHDACLSNAQSGQANERTPKPGFRPVAHGAAYRRAHALAG